MAATTSDEQYSRGRLKDLSEVDKICVRFFSVSDNCPSESLQTRAEFKLID